MKDFADKTVEFKSQCLAMIKNINGEDNNNQPPLNKISISTATSASFIDKEEEIDRQKVCNLFHFCK